ncbi:hypothetical protein D805_0275 [Bifidobacterium thermophilum RBL67]|uniref:Uncharacterized protein n=1 Tax=Bifidobacterium thermophilum RBL67 TaxID=1254439 RepID=M4RPT2_9BIFI|nr:hypothetical protein D805_0275 [Bifidobacterium thermophilum RBL67]
MWRLIRGRGGYRCRRDPSAAGGLRIAGLHGTRPRLCTREDEVRVLQETLASTPISSCRVRCGA